MRNVLHLGARVTLSPRLILTLAAMMHSAPAMAQGIGAMTRGSGASAGRITIISGTVTGPNGVILTGAAVEARSNQGFGTRTTVTSPAGKYTIIANDSSTSFKVTVRATGYVAWSGDVSRSMTDDRIVLNVTLKEGGTAADWPAPPRPTPALQIARAQLGPSDAIDITADVGDIAVVGRPVDHVIVHTYSHNIVPGDDTAWTMPPEIPEAGTHSFGAGGLSIATASGTSVMIEVPADLKSIKLSNTGHGAINVAGFNGELSIQSAGGSVLLNQVGGPTIVEARSGDISANLSTIPAAMNILGRNGTIKINAPADGRATVVADVHGGTITLDSTSRLVIPNRRFSPSELESFRIGMPPADKASRLRWPLNGGGAAITVTSLNGNIIVRRPAPKLPAEELDRLPPQLEPAPAPTIHFRLGYFF